MNKKLHTASCLPMLAEFHTMLKQSAGFDDELGFVPAVDAVAARHIESAACLVADDCAETIELLARLIAYRDPLAGDDEQIIGHIGGALRVIGSTLRLAQDTERAASHARHFHEAESRRQALPGE